MNQSFKKLSEMSHDPSCNTTSFTPEFNPDKENTNYHSAENK